MKAIYKSQIDIGSLLILIFLLAIFTISVYEILEVELLRIIVLVFAFYILYKIIHSIVYFFSFFEDKIILTYVCAITKKEKVFLYSDIKEIRYLNKSGFSLPTIVFVSDKKIIPRLLSSSNSFTIRSFSRRKKILLFLQSKNIPIYVDSLSKKDIFIFKDLENITYSDDYWVKNS